MRANRPPVSPVSRCVPPRDHARSSSRTANIGVSELRKRYVERGRPLPADVEAALRSDARAGAQQILAAVERRRRENRAEGQRLRKMLRYEQALWATGVLRVAGVDEAGMSPLAGPVAAAAVVLPIGCRITGVDDSKKLTAERRDELADEIRQVAVAYCVAFAEPDEIDRINIYWAGLLAMRRAVEGLAERPQHLLLDARKLKGLDIPQQAIVHGDALSASIAAASILAKTTRDARMRDLDGVYPGYGFAQHKGYPVREHADALVRLGACPVHRRSFAPVREALGLPPEPPLVGPQPPPATTPELATDAS
jgi:ribonuclease HII